VLTNAIGFKLQNAAYGMAKKVLFVVVFAVDTILTLAQYPPDINTDSILTRHLQIVSNLTDGYLYNPDSYISGKSHYSRGTNDNHPFFLVNYWKSGSAKYKDIVFSLPMMKYDIEYDVLVILKIIENLVYSVQLNRSIIQEFSLEGHHFDYLDKVSNAGYYEKLYSAQTTVWAKWTKRSKVDAHSVSGIPVYVPDLYFVIQYENKYYIVKNLREILNVFSDRKQELKSYNRVNNLSFRKDKTGTIIKMAEQFDLLNN